MSSGRKNETGSKIKIGSMVRYPLGNPSVGEGSLQDGSFLTFNLCNPGGVHLIRDGSVVA